MELLPGISGYYVYLVRIRVPVEALPPDGTSLGRIGNGTAREEACGMCSAGVLHD